MVYDVIIPFRDRGTDPLRQENLVAVLDMWEEYGYVPYVMSDGRSGNQQFNRSAAYNTGIRLVNGDTDGFIFAESDMLIHDRQVEEAVALAEKQLGLVVPFTDYHYLRPKDSIEVRKGVDPALCRPQWIMANGRSIGAINVVSRKTMECIGRWDERFEGNWYDDDSMKIAFDVCAGPTRWVEGPAYHLYHLPGHRGDHLTTDDRHATLHNKHRLRQYESAQRHDDADRIRLLTSGRI